MNEVNTNGINGSLVFGRVLFLTVCGGFSLCSFLLAVNVVGSVVTGRISELRGVIASLIIIGSVTVLLYILASRCVGRIEKSGRTVEIISYIGNTVVFDETEFIKAVGLYRGLYVKTKKKGWYLISLFTNKYKQDLEKLFPFTE